MIAATTKCRGVVVEINLSRLSIGIFLQEDQSGEEQSGEGTEGSRGRFSPSLLVDTVALPTPATLSVVSSGYP